jgi:prolyl 4-hydroxylase
MGTLNSLNHYIRTYEHSLSADVCRQMIASFEELGRHQRRNGQGITHGLEQSAWTEMNVSKLSDEGFAKFFRKLINEALLRYNTDVGLSIPIPNSPKTSDLLLKRYEPNGLDQFELHFDSIYDASPRYLVFLWYLNAVDGGGATEFPDLGYSVEPAQGRLLMFPPYWMYQHKGLPPLNGPKYILSSYLLFESSDPA